ncbi:protein ALTERED PHOSPHATE STARVATION RESPONSE 1-like [Carex rostrata]
MGNCAATRLAGAGLGLSCSDSDDPVSLCRERKRLIKSAVAQRRALSCAHAEYIDSLHSVATALDLFILRHSAPAPILITLPPSSPTKIEALTFHSEEAQKINEAVKEEKEEKVQEVEVKQEPEMGCGYYFEEEGEMTMPSPPPTGTNGLEGWDFFNPFYGFQTGVQTGLPTDPGFCKASNEEEEEALRMVREKEGIPELEEAEPEAEMEKKVVGFEEEEKAIATGEDCNGGTMEEKALEVSELSVNRKELLEALKDVCDLFFRAYNSGKDISRMLEVSRKEPLSAIEEAKESQSKVMKITWHRSPSSLSSSSYRSHNSSWTDSNSQSDIFEEYGMGMTSGSHSQTLGRLYAWEKKLYDEVKAGDKTRQAYEKKCLQLRHQDIRRADLNSGDKTRSGVRDLYSRILVALRAVESISEKIQKLRDEELQPQLVELIQGLARNWKIMLDSHETQKEIMFSVNCFTCPAYGKFSNDAQRHATLKLEAEVRNWRSCFSAYISAQKAYIEALNGWLSKFITPDPSYYTKPKNGVPPLVLMCNEWVVGFGKLPDKQVLGSIRNFVRSVRVLWIKQGEEQQQKRKVDSLAKEIDKKLCAFKRAENRVLETKLLEHKPEADAKQRLEHLAERKEMLNNLRKRLDTEKLRHHDCMRETHDVTLNGFKIGLAGIFESLTDFSKDSYSLYNSLLENGDKSKEFEKIEAAHVEALNLNSS